MFFNSPSPESRPGVLILSINSNRILRTYLTGLIEGDGLIIVPSSLRNSKGRKQAVHVEIEFAIEDFLLTKKLQEVLMMVILITELVVKIVD